jgi:hypothetical protein
MTILFTQYLELLKATVLAKSGLNNISPCDCKVISVQILKKTRHSVSETTLKRVYGFAFSKFKPSVFTIDVMAKYCGYDGWDDFCKKQSVKHNNNAPGSTNWDTLKQSAGKITSFTLQALKNKSGIPYNQTIRRAFIDDHFNEFLTGNYTATVFSAPAGYGKTIALCHWVEERLTLNAQGKTDDIILFFSGSALMNVFLSGRDLNDWILALLGYSADDDIRLLMDIQEKHPGNFYLIIDNLDEHIYKTEQFKLLLNQVIDIFSLYQSTAWFKLVLTMRAATWLNNRHHIQSNNEKWFSGFIDDNAINVPLFNIREIKEICLKINPTIHNFVTLETADSFNHPLYFQFYYKKHKDDFSLSKIDHICVYDLISAFILNKVYLGHNSAEKVLLLIALINEMDLTNPGYAIFKPKVNTLLKQYAHAYNDLINVGFLRELNNSSDFNYQTVIKFGNDSFLEYSIAKTLLANNNYIFDAELIRIINTTFNNNPRKLFILKWCVIYAIKTGQQKSFELLAQVDLNPTERSDLIIFLGELFEKASTSNDNTESLVQYFKQDCSVGLFNYFFGLEFINVRYKETLLTLLKFNLSNRKRILIYSALAMSALLRLDMGALAGYINKLKSFPAEDYSKFAVNPLKCLEALCGYLNLGLFKKDIFIDITRFYFNPPCEGKYFNHNASNDMVYLLAAYTVMLSKNPLKALRFINALQKNYKKANLAAINGYSYFIKTVAADCYFILNRTSELIEIYEEFKALYKNDKTSFTDYMKTVYFGLRIKVNVRLNKYTYIIEDMKVFSQIAGEHKLSKLYILIIVLDSADIANLYPQFYKQSYYDYTRLVRECGLPPDVFLKKAPLIQ